MIKTSLHIQKESAVMQIITTATITPTIYGHYTSNVFYFPSFLTSKANPFCPLAPPAEPLGSSLTTWQLTEEAFFSGSHFF